MIDLQDELVNALAGRYEIERQLGHGGMALVYLARDIRNSRKVALKVLRPELANSLGAERFLQEIALSAPLVHPNIVALYDSGEAAGSLYYTMPYIDGPTLRQRLDREVQLPIEDAIAITRQVAAALDHAHASGLVHRDIKPDNILSLGNHVLVADFGLARAITRAASKPLTTQGIIVGTPPYMSPEQCTPNGTITTKSDIYSLGCVVFEMIAGVTPFRSATTEATISHHLSTDPPSLCAERSSCPSAIDAVVRRALAKSPADRFRTAGEFASALEAAVNSGPGVHIPPTAVARSPVRSTRRRWIPLVAGAALVAALAAAYYVRVKRPLLRLGDRDWLLVADFAGPKDDPSVPVAIRELVTAELNQSPFLRTVSRQQLNSVMRSAGVAETTHVDAELARQLAYRSAVRAIVVGNIQQLGEGRYSLALHVVSADDGKNVYSTATTAMEKDLIPAVGELARNVRLNLGEKRKSIEATLPLLEAATPSFPAYRKFLDGMTRVRTGDIPGGNALIRQSLELDPEFASAWAAIGANYLGARQLDSAQIALGKALEAPGRLTQAQRYRLQGDIAYAIQYDIPAAVRWYDLFLAEYPNSIGGRNNRALYVSAIGRYEDAAADLKTTIEASPFGPAHVQINLFNMAAMLVASAQVDEAEATVRSLQPPFSSGAKLLIAVARDHWADVVTISDSIAAQPRTPALIRLLGTTGRASALAATDKAAEASRQLRQARDSANGATARWYDRADLLLSLANGSRPAAVTLSSSDSSASQALTMGLRAAVAGDTSAARRHLRRVESATSHEQALLGLGPALVRGWIAAAERNWEEVTRSLAKASLEGEHDATLLDRVSSLEVRWLVANAYAARGQLDSAQLHMRKALASDHVPAGHLVLRGLVLPSARARAAEWANQAPRPVALR